MDFQGEANCQGEVRRREWEEHERRWRKEQANRKRNTGLPDGSGATLKIMNEWAFVRNVEELFSVDRLVASYASTTRGRRVSFLRPLRGGQSECGLATDYRRCE